MATAASFSAPVSSPPVTTATPLKMISALSGLNFIPALPTAAIIRPQFGSPPKNAVLTRNDSAMVRAALLASPLVAAPVTCTSIKRVAPSPSLTIIWASSTERRVRSRTKALYSSEERDVIGEAPEAPLANIITVSLVEVSLSTMMELNELSAASLRAAFKTGAVTAASVRK